MSIQIVVGKVHERFPLIPRALAALACALSALLHLREAVQQIMILPDFYDWHGSCNFPYW